MCEVLRVNGLVDDSVVDGLGLRLAVFTQGCPHRCPGCHNPQTHDPAGGTQMSILDIAARARKNPLLAGVTLTGGEPFAQPEACLALVRALPEGLTVWAYSGWTFEELLTDSARRALAEACDVIVDGPFRQGEKSLGLLFRGSRNQRLVDARASFARGETVLWTPPAWY